MKENVMRSVERGFETFRRLFEGSETPEVLERIDTLRHASLFRNFSFRQLRILARAVHPRRFKSSEPIYFEGDPGLGMYLVQEGVVRLTITDEDGRDREVARVQASGLFGDLSTFGEFPRLESAQAVTETELLGFFRPDLMTIIKRHPRLGAQLSLSMAQSLALRQVAVLREVTATEGKFAARGLMQRALVEYDGTRDAIVNT